MLRTRETENARDCGMRTISLRAIFLIGFVIAMPILALPSVARRLDDWMYGPPPTEAALAPLRSEVQQLIEPQVAERASPASFDEVDPAIAHRPPNQGLDAPPPDLPPLSPLPVFPPLVSTPEPQPPAKPQSTSQSRPLSEADTQRLIQNRTELERLGADYMVLETTDMTGSYRFHCDIRLDEQTRYTRPFEAIATEPLAAAEKVLAEVSAWRTAARPAETRR
jgi:hypothetical protein